MKCLQRALLALYTYRKVRTLLKRKLTLMPFQLCKTEVDLS